MKKSVVIFFSGTKTQIQMVMEMRWWFRGCRLQPAGFVSDNTDCDDLSLSIAPNGIEFCNGRDDDCDGTVDEAAVDSVNYYLDFDGDGYGDATLRVFCPVLVQGLPHLAILRSAQTVMTLILVALQACPSCARMTLTKTVTETIFWVRWI